MPLAEMLTTLPDFLLYLAAGLLLLTIFTVVYTWLTQHPEWQLIRAGNSAAATALAGALLGFALPLASAIAHAVNIWDMLLWAALALLVQWATYIVTRLLLPGLPERIERGDIAAAITTGAFSLSAGLINAACMTY